jgi:hypothetical protein
MAEGHRPPIPYLEFYETDELGGQLDNWSGPTVSAVQALVRSAGFARAEVLAVSDTTARIAAHRTWRDLPSDQGPPTDLLGLNAHLHRGRSFQSHKEQYIALWCTWNEPEAPTLDRVFPMVDEFGIAPLGATLTDHGLLVNLRLPPGLSPGSHKARLKIGSFGWSREHEFFVDLPPTNNTITIGGLQDGITWESDKVDWDQGGWLTVWVDGLTPEADPGNTQVFIGGVPHCPEAVAAEQGQINVRLRPMIRAIPQTIYIVHRGARSDTRDFEVHGTAPVIRGLGEWRAEG